LLQPLELVGQSKRPVGKQQQQQQQQQQQHPREKVESHLPGEGSFPN